MAAKTDTLYRVKESFITTIGGEEMEYQAGQLVQADDPAVKKFPHLFGELETRPRTRTSPDVEQATAAPGEKRGG